MSEPPLVAGTIECPKCGYQQIFGEKTWGIRLILCKPCELKRQVVSSADPKQPDPPDNQLLYNPHR